MSHTIFRITFILSTLFIISCADDTQKACDSQSYVDNIFTETVKTTVEYATETAVNGKSVILRMDVYEPANDEAEDRAVMIWAHGGSFVGGSRLDMTDLCKSMALKGYVSATIDYRLLDLAVGFPDSVSATDIAIKASQDFRSAIYWFVTNAKGANKYKIDPNSISIGGVSAGAITALNAGVLDESDAVPTFVKNLMNKNGGISGTTIPSSDKNTAFPIKGIVNLSGAVINPAVIDSNDPPIFSMHGDQDDVVPYDFGFVRVGNIPIMRLYGSKQINEAATKAGIKTSLTTVPGGKHVDIYLEARYASVYNDFTTKTNAELKSLICN